MAAEKKKAGVLGLVVLGKDLFHCSRTLRPLDFTNSAHQCKAEHVKDCDIVFSGLDSDVAGEDGLYLQKALQDNFGPLENVEVFTQQAIGGAGYPGVPSSDILDNIQILIPSGDDNLENETQKVLGAISSDCTAFKEQAGLTVGAICTRVAVTDGHMAFVSIRFKNRDTIPFAEQAKQAMREYISDAQKLECPSAPEQAIVVFDEPDRPQPRLDSEISGGCVVSVGRVRETAKGSYFDLRFAALSHNTVIGSAGPSTLNDEAAILKGFI